MVTLTGVRSDPAQLNTPATQTGYRPDDQSDHAHRQLIGYIGLVLPILLILMALVRDGVARWRNLDSISAYYYTGAAPAFIGLLVALALFLFTYRGYNNKYYCADRAVSITAVLARHRVRIRTGGRAAARARRRSTRGRRASVHWQLPRVQTRRSASCRRRSRA